MHFKGVDTPAPSTLYHPPWQTLAPYRPQTLLHPLDTGDTFVRRPLVPINTQDQYRAHSAPPCPMLLLAESIHPAAAPAHPLIVGALPRVLPSHSYASTYLVQSHTCYPALCRPSTPRHRAILGLR